MIRWSVLADYRRPLYGDDLQENYIDWGDAEHALSHVEADLLVILDWYYCHFFCCSHEDEADGMKSCYAGTSTLVKMGSCTRKGLGFDRCSLEIDTLAYSA